jgi:hypothetical protein
LNVELVFFFFLILELKWRKVKKKCLFGVE